MTARENIRYYRKKHAITRLMDRHAIVVSEEEYEGLCEQITSQTAEFVGRLSKAKTVWYVTVQNHTLPCIYHKKTNGIVTFCNNKWVKELKKLAQKRIEKLSKGDEYESTILETTIKTSVANRKTKQQLREIKDSYFEEAYA